MSVMIKNVFNSSFFPPQLTLEIDGVNVTVSVQPEQLDPLVITQTALDLAKKYRSERALQAKVVSMLNVDLEKDVMK